MNPPSAPKSLQSTGLCLLKTSQPHSFVVPSKRIHEGKDVPHFLSSKGYGDIGIFVMQLNFAMCPRKILGSDKAQTWQLDSAVTLSEPVRKLQELMHHIDTIIEEAPPDTGPRRFGNVSFRKWFKILESRSQELLETYLPPSVVAFDAADSVSAVDEIKPYLLGAFGSSQRLDYGTGHELSFLAFLACIWKLGGFSGDDSQDGSLERSLVVGVLEPYLRVVRRLILTYTLEPAGSHGVWGLDDHFFLPYIFGSSQYCPAVSTGDSMPVEGFLPGSPNPGDVAKKNIVDRERLHNMYFAAIGFINDVKTGPFWEHSPILFDISGVRSGWGKINKGMIKMYNAEVLSKFPVVQHFPFGSLLSWEQDVSAIPVPSSVHTASQPSSNNNFPMSQQETTKAPWTTQSPGNDMQTTRAPWANAATSSAMGPTAAPWATSSRQAQYGVSSTRKDQPYTPSSSQPRNSPDTASKAV